MAFEDLEVDELMFFHGSDGQRHFRGKLVVEGVKHEAHFHRSPLAPLPFSVDTTVVNNALTLMNSQASQARTNIAWAKPSELGNEPSRFSSQNPNTFNNKKATDACCVDKSTSPLNTRKRVSTRIHQSHITTSARAYPLPCSQHPLNLQLTIKQRSASRSSDPHTSARKEEGDRESPTGQHTKQVQDVATAGIG